MFQSNLQSFTEVSDGRDFKSPDMQGRLQAPKTETNGDAETDNNYPDPRMSGIFQDHGLFKDLDSTVEHPSRVQLKSPVQMDMSQPTSARRPDPTTGYDSTYRSLRRPKKLDA